MSESRFDRTADRYAASAAAKDWTRFVELCRPRPDDRALDVAAGPGFLSAALAPLVAEVVALDESEALLSHAPKGVTRVVGAAERLPFDDGTFTLVTIVNSLHHVGDMAAVLAEMVRVLAPVGRIAVQDYLADDDPATAERWDAVERLRDGGHRKLPRRGEVAELLAGHGLRLEEEREWRTTWQLAPWLDMADTPQAARDHVHEMVGADDFEATAWMGRFGR
ncbi:MAG TPA: methyltransferase domain-containing protein [Gaiellales bacterium]|nr:methyltransferase domain-containing protein [Gaiellales bacterium]